MPKLDLSTVEQVRRTGYPPPYDKEVQGRLSRKIGVATGLTDFGVTETVLEAGAWSSQRHWHEDEDEVVIMLEGEAVLVEDGGRTPMRAGEIAVFRKGISNGHHFINESGSVCRLLAIGKAAVGDCHYPDIDMHLDGATQQFTPKPR